MRHSENGEMDVLSYKGIIKELGPKVKSYPQELTSAEPRVLHTH